MESTQTIGQVRVRPEYRELSEEEKQAVEDFKDTAATFIDACEALKIEGCHDRGRLVSIAQTKMEEAVMFAVKAVTSPVPVNEETEEAAAEDEGNEAAAE